MSTFQTIALVGKYQSHEVAAALGELVAILREHRRTVLIEASTAASLGNLGARVASYEEIGTQADLAVVAGGEIGTLKPGALADVAIFDLLDGNFTYYDVFMSARTGKQMLRNAMTIVNGRQLAQQSDPPPMPWIELSPDQQALIERGHTPDAMAGR